MQKSAASSPEVGLIAHCCIGCTSGDLLGNCHRARKLARCRELLGMASAGPAANPRPADVRNAVARPLAQVLESGANHFGLVDKALGIRIREKPPLVYRLSKHDLPARNAISS